MNRWMISMMLLLLIGAVPVTVSAQEDEESGDDATEATEPAEEATEAAEEATEAAEGAAEEATEAAEGAAEEAAEEAAEVVEEAAAEAPADAAEAAEAVAEDAAANKPTISLVAEAGVVWLAGNTQSITANGGVAFGLSVGRHAIGLNVGGNYGRSVIKTEVDEDGDGTIDRVDSAWATSATRVFGDLRYDLSIIPDMNSIYAGFGMFHDPFAGYVYRLRGDVGYSHTIVNTGVHNLVGEAGFNYTRELYVDDVTTDADDDVSVRTQNFVGARLFAGYTLTPSDAFGFFVNVETLLGGTDNVDARFDGRLIAETGVTANLSKVFSIKLGFLLNYDFVPPDVDGVEGPDVGPLDTTTTATLVATLF